MKQILFQIKPSFILTALIFLCASIVPIGLIKAKSPNFKFSHIASPILLSDESNSTTPIDADLESDLEEGDDDPEEDDPENPEPPEEDEAYEFSSNLIIKAVNPGYSDTKNELSNVGELIELQNLADAPISLAGFSLRYTNGSNKSNPIYEFADESLMTGEYLLLRYYKSPDSEKSDLTYKTSLGLTASPLELLYNGEVVDSACWTGKGTCNAVFKSANPTTLVRNLTTGEFEHLSEYEPHYDPNASNFYLPPQSEEPDTNDQKTDPDSESIGTPKCRGLEFSEILTYYSDNQSEQFIELYNPTSSTIDLDGCKIQYKKKNYNLSGVIPPDQYLTYYPQQNFSLTKNPTTTNSVLLIDADSETIDELIYPNGQKKLTSYSRFFDESGQEIWRVTYIITPAAPNVYQEFRTCPAGKVINPATGNCVNATSLTTTLAECPAGKYRNPLTGRCKNIETSSSTLKECAEGYERNPETNRCRKVTQENTGADFAIVPSTRSDQTVFIGFGIVTLLVSGGAVYIVLQFRREIARALRKARQRFHHVSKDLFSGKISWHRDKKP